MSRNTATIDGSKEKRRYLTLLAGTVALIGSLFIGIAAGAVPITLREVFEVIQGVTQSENYRIIYYSYA